MACVPHPNCFPALVEAVPKLLLFPLFPHLTPHSSLGREARGRRREWADVEISAPDPSLPSFIHPPATDQDSHPQQFVLASRQAPDRASRKHASSRDVLSRHGAADGQVLLRGLHEKAAVVVSIPLCRDGPNREARPGMNNAAPAGQFTCGTVRFHADDPPCRDVCFLEIARAFLRDLEPSVARSDRRRKISVVSMFI